jgi:hypothetical protein
MHKMTIRLSDDDSDTLAWLATYHAPQRRGGLAYSEVIRIALRNDRERAVKIEAMRTLPKNRKRK